MRSIPALLVVALFTACGPADEPAEQASGPTLADFAGAWQNTVMVEGTEEPIMSTMGGSADGSDWKMTLEGRPDIPVQVSMMGDSLIAVTAEYESVLRAGVMVTVRTASVLSDGMLMGNMVATYRMPDGQEQVMGTLHGMRAPN